MWHIAVDPKKGRFIREPAEVYARLIAPLMDMFVDPTDAFWMREEEDLYQEMSNVKKDAERGMVLSTS